MPGRHGSEWVAGMIGILIFEWYRETYGDRNKIDFTLGHVVMVLQGTYWRIRIPLSYGTVRLFASRQLGQQTPSLATRGQEPPSYNVLDAVQGLTQVYANRLSEAELVHVFKSFAAGSQALAVLDAMRGEVLFEEAKGDYHHSVSALMDGPTFGKARWDNAQAAEKLFKGLLSEGKQAYPKGGPKAHDIVHLGGLVQSYLGIPIPESLLRTINCPTGARYAEMNVDQNEAWTSHMALLSMLRVIGIAKFSQLAQGT